MKFTDLITEEKFVISLPNLAVNAVNKKENGSFFKKHANTKEMMKFNSIPKATQWLKKQKKADPSMNTTFDISTFPKMAYVKTIKI